MKAADWAVLLIATGVIFMLTGSAAVLLTDLPGTRQHFAVTMFDVVSRAFPFLSVKARLLIVAHAAHESGWGQLSNGRKVSNNVFNLTAGSSWKGPTIGGTDVDANENPIAQNWRVYPSLDAAVADYWTFLGNFDPTAKSVLLLSPGVVDFAHALKLGRYYEAPEASYAAGLQSALAEVLSYVQVSA
jgi:flagellum-specific peptidoglycan hydrolase FlgJ